MNLLKDSVSNVLQRARPAEIHGVVLTGLIALTLALAGCGGGGGGGSAPSSSSSTDGSGGGAGTGGGSNGGSGGGGGTGNSAGPVVYLANQQDYQKYELFLADGAGGSVKLNGPLTTDANVNEFQLTVAGDAVVYTADQTTVNRTELYIVSLANPGATTRLNTPLTTNRDVIDFVVSPDGTKVVYRADQNADDVFELYLVDVANPGMSVKINSTLVAGGWVRAGFSFSPDGSKMMYRADQDTYDKTELYLVNVASPGVSQKINPPLVSGGNVFTGFAFSPDGSTVGYVSDQDTDEMLELYAVSVATPGVSQKLNGPLIPEGDVCRFEFSPDSSRVAYCADQQTDEVIELFTTALATPGQSVKLNAPLAAGGAVTTGYDFSPDSSFMVYAAKQESAARTDLYRVDIAAPGVTTKLNAELTSGGHVVNFHIRADGSHVGYIANQENAAAFELYETAFETPGVATKLSSPVQAGGLYTFQYSASGTDVVYLSAHESDSPEVYRVQLATPGVAQQINSNLVIGGEVWDFQTR